MDSLFWFRKGEFRGIIFIVSLAVLWIGIEACYAHFSKPDPLTPQNRERLLSLLDQPSPEFAFAMAEQKDSIAKGKTNYQKKNWKRISQVYVEQGEFNPNTLDDEGWISRGLTSKQLKTLRNFQSKGAHFNDPEDLDKIYGWNKEWLSLAKLNMVIPVQNKEAYSARREPEVQSNQNAETETIEAPPVLPDVNSMDSLSLVNLRGIGPFYAHQIVEYRSQLGGFYDHDQLKEVYKMRDENWTKLIGQIKIDPSKINCLPLNLKKAEELARHPYISWVQAKGLVSYRELHGEFDGVEDMIGTHLFSDEELLKLKPYLCFDD